MTELAAANLCCRDGREPSPGWEALHPEDVVTSELSRHETELASLREQHRMVRSLSGMYWRQRDLDHYEGIEVIYGPEILMDTVAALQQRARTQVRACVRPPYYSLQSQLRRDTEASVQAARMAEGITYRAIWDASTWDGDIPAQAALRSIANGEQARQLPNLPMKLYIIDDDRAILPLDPAQHRDRANLVVHPSGLLTALIAVFEFYWQFAGSITPYSAVPPDEGNELTPRDQAIVTMLAAGSNDEAIARRLAVSRSTVTRTVRELEDRFGARSRFQLAATLSQHGVL